MLCDKVKERRDLRGVRHRFGKGTGVVEVGVMKKILKNYFNVIKK